MFPCSSFSLSTLLYMLAYSVYRASMPSTDVSRRWEVPVPAVVFDYRVDGDTNDNLDLPECSTIALGLISGLLEPNVFATVSLDSPAHLPDDVEIAVGNAAPQGIIRQLLEPAVIETVNTVAVVQVTPAATTPVDSTPRSASVVDQPTRLSLRVAWAQSNLRMFKSLALSAFVVVVVASLAMVFKQASQSFRHQFFQSIPISTSRPWRSSVLGSSAQVLVFTMIIIVLISFAMGFLARSVSFEKLSAILDKLYPLFIDLCSCFGTMASCVIESAASNIVEGHLGGGIRHGEVVVEDIPISEQAEHGSNLEASVDTASLPSGSVCNNAVQPSRTSVSIQAMPEVHEVKDVSIGTEPVSRTSVGVQCELAPEESKNIFAPAESRGSLYATAVEGNSPSQMMDNPDVFSVPAVSSVFNIYTTAQTISFPSVEDLANMSDFECLRQDVRGFGYESEADGRTAPSLPAMELGVSPSPSTPASPRPVRAKPLEYFRERWGADTKHLWAREFWHQALRSEELIKTVYHAMFLLDEAATDEDKYEMEVGEGLVSIVRISAWRLLEHATNPILWLPYNAPSEDADHHDSLFVSAEAKPTIQTAVSSSASIGTRSPSPFARPSNPQSQFLESSLEALVAAPTIPSPLRTPVACRRRPALAQITNAPHVVKATPSRTPMKVGWVQGARNAVPTPPPSLRPKLAKGKACFPPVVPKMRFEDESMSPTRPAHRCPPSSKFPRWRG
ncbi:uncharacterized protein ARMOST_06627 [Armillaria ostoyae]|uniref:Uncharacterized protein n=1 Tax=Armillaria ostoyae TaxID=47428 RepID=A0A284R3L1_ARMOS|nr:uncharacterized protein ARMOST_06627 [Armillaria ostoyae]